MPVIPPRLNLPSQPRATVTRPASTAPRPVTSTSRPTASTSPSVQVYPRGLVKALFVGINYDGMPEIALRGCINDVQNTQILLRQMYPNSKTEFRALTDATAIKPTRKNILEAIQWLVADLKPGQNVFFHYSGHGIRILDRNGDEASGLDSCICPYDGSKLEIISDDELREALATKIPAGSTCFAVIDACNSGTAMDLQYIWQAPRQDSLVFTQNRRYPATRGKVIFLSASSDEQYAMDTVNTFGTPGGALTFALLATWSRFKTIMKMKHLLWNVRKFLKDRGYEQIPQLSSGGAMSSEELIDLSR